MDRKERAVLICIGANALLIALRFILAFISGSLGLKANAWHSLTDVLVLVIVYLGLVVVRRGLQRHTNLLLRTEHLSAVVVSFFMFWMGFELFSEAVGGEAIELAYVIPTAIGAFLGVCITYFMGRYMCYVGKETGSPSLLAAGTHARMDMFCSVAVLVGLIGSIMGLSGLDKVAAVIVVVFIFQAAIEMFFTNFKGLVSSKVQLSEESHLHKYPSGLITAGLFVLIVIGYMASGFYYVKPSEQAVVQRLGKVRGEPLAPGLHYRLPYPIDNVTLVRTTPVRQVSTDAKLLLTGDENLIDVEVSVHYTVSDPVKFLLNQFNPETLIKQAAQASVRRTVGHMAIDNIMAEGRSGALREIWKILQEELDKSKSGLQVVDVLFRKLRPPEDVVEAFQDVASAREDKLTYMNEAYSFRNALVPKARGEAATLVLQARATKQEKIRYAEGEADRFTKTLNEYAKSAEITEIRLYLEAMEKVLPRTEKFLVGGNINTASPDLWFLGKDAGPVLEGK